MKSLKSTAKKTSV